MAEDRGGKLAGRIGQSAPSPDQVQSLFDYLAAGNVLPPNVVYVSLHSPLGTAIIDPFAAAADPRAQRILQSLGVEVHLGFGPPPASVVEEAEQRPLFSNLQTLGLVAGGVALLWLLSSRTR